MFVYNLRDDETLVGSSKLVGKNMHFQGIKKAIKITPRAANSDFTLLIFSRLGLFGLNGYVNENWLVRSYKYKEIFTRNTVDTFTISVPDSMLYLLIIPFSSYDCIRLLCTTNTYVNIELIDPPE